MWIFLRKELLSSLLTLRFASAVIFTLVLASVTTFIGSLDFSRNMAAYHKEVKKVQEALDKATVYQTLQPHIVVPPQPLSVLCKGTVRTAGQQYYVNLNLPWMAAWQVSGIFDSSYIRTLTQIDFATVVALLLSFLAVVLGFDGICGERERGTLKQVLTSPVPRAHIVLAKLLGGMIILWVSFAIALSISLLIMLINPDIVLAADDWGRLAFLAGLSCLFLGLTFSLSLMVSSFTRNTGTALIICLFAWLVSGIGYINMLPSFSRYGHDEPPYQEYLDQDQLLWDELNATMTEWDNKNPAPGEAYLKGIQRSNRLRYAHPQGYDWMQRRNAVEWDKRIELADRRAKIRWANQSPLAQEAHLVDQWSILSPVTNYLTLSYLLARTTLDDMFYLGREGRRYREAYIGYLRSKKAFASRRWFSDDPPDQEPMIPHPEEISAEMLAPDSPYMLERMAWAEAQEKQAVDDDRRQLDLTDMPKFGRDWQRPLAESLQKMMPGLVTLLLSFAVSIWLTVLRFLRYDPS